MWAPQSTVESRMAPSSVQSAMQGLKELGHGDAAIARIKGPVGLDIGAVTAPEIAVAILAEFVAARRNGALAPKLAEPAAA